jgi:hydrogenase expression/formation protein HypC
MCLAVPGKILEVSESGAAVGRTATVDFQGSRVEASLAMTPDASVGDWVLLHAGFALAVLDETEARETFETLRLAFGEDAGGMMELEGGMADRR